MPFKKIASVLKLGSTQVDEDGVFFNNLSDSSADSANLDGFDVTEDYISIRALGQVRKKMLLISDFYSLNVAIPADVEWVLSENNYLIIDCHDSFLKYLIIEVADGCLTIGSRAVLSGGRPKVKIFGSMLGEIHASRQSHVKVEGLDCQRIIATANDDSSIEMSGTVSEGHYEATGFSQIDALSVDVGIVIAEIHTDSLILCKTSDAVQAKIYKNGILVNIGNPKIVEIEHVRESEY